jgi:hypothetical protein
MHRGGGSAAVTIEEVITEIAATGSPSAARPTTAQRGRHGGPQEGGTSDAPAPRTLHDSHWPKDATPTSCGWPR